MKKTFLLIFIIFTSLVADVHHPHIVETIHHEWTFDECGQSELDILIDSFGDSIYVCTERNGGGQNGEEYEKIIKKYIEEIKILLQKSGVSINHQDNNGITPLMRAAHHSSWESIELLMQAGADPSLTGNKNGWTALDFLSLTNRAPLGSICFIMNVIMSNYNNKERYNKCVDLLTKNIIKRVWYKRWLPNKYRWWYLDLMR